ncbi:MAG: peptidylprolyl isomerase [Candidatus Limnocylindria bacterium]
MRAVRRGTRAGPAALLVLAVACQGGGPGITTHDCPTDAPSASQAADILASTTGTASFETTLGSFTIELLGDVAPIAAANFVALARCGFYEGITFHRVIAGFVAQAGDPNTRENQGDFEGLGSGGPGYGFAIELPPEGINYDPYTVAMANSGEPDSNGSQFFICLTAIDAQLPGRLYTIFGLVSAGTEVVDAIGAIEVGNAVTNVPVDPVVINRVVVEAPESTPD